MEKHFRLIFTSDSHGYLYPTNFVDAGEQELGLMRLASQFPHDGNTLILDGGDTIQGSPMTNLYSRLGAEEKAACVADGSRGAHPFAAVMNIAGVQTVTLGNHDFNMGIEGLSAFLGSLDADCVCCNIRDRAHELPIRPYVIRTLENGLRIGIAGACTDYVRFWENPETVKKLEIEDPVARASEVLAEMRGQCDVTVLLYHGGYECDLNDGHPLTESRENQACRICRELEYDIVLTGHQHMSVPLRKIGNSWTAQPAYRGMEAVVLEGSMGEKGLCLAGSSLHADGKSMPEAERILKPLRDRTEAWLDEPAGHLDRPLDVGEHIAMALAGCPLANFINTVQQEASGAQISANALANEVKGLPTEVTVRNVVAAYIYSNTMVVLELPVPVLRQYMERSAAYFRVKEDGSVCVSDSFLLPKVQHYNYDYFSGVDYTIDLRRGEGDRITSLTMNGKPLTDEESVTVCINSYRFNGTGGYEMLPGQKVVREVQTDVADAIIDYLLSHPDIHVDTHRWCTVVR